MRTKRVVAIIQTRMGSSRLPGKVMMQIAGKPMLWHVVNRVKRSKLVNKVVVATSTRLEDKKIVNFCKKNGIDFFVGPEEDVLARYFLAAKKTGADIIVRITADCPLVDSKLIDKAISALLRGKYDHAGIATGAGVAKSKIKKFPDGMDCSVFTFKSLEYANLHAKDKNEREHVNMYIWKRPRRFKLANLESGDDYSKIRLTVDYREDLSLIRKIYHGLYPRNHYFGLSDIIRFIKANPKLLKINEKYIGKEGYLKLWQRKREG